MLRAHVGVVWCAARGLRAEDAVHRAEAALDTARRSDASRVARHDDGGDPRTQAVDRLEGAVRRALRDPDLRTHYHPVLSTKGGRVDGFELVLWKRPRG